MAVGGNWAAVGLGSIVWRAYADSLVPMDADPTPYDLSEPEVTARTHVRPPCGGPHGVGDGCV